VDTNQIYSHLKDGRFREAFQTLWQWWLETKWEARFVGIGMVILLLLAWIYSAAGFVLSLLAAPLGICALIAVARPAPVPDRVDGLVRWAGDKRQKALAKGTFFAKWVMRPFYASLSGEATLTRPIKDRYLRAGVTITLQIYTLYLALFIASVTIYMVLFLLCLAFILWMIAYALSDHSGSRTMGRAVSWGLSRRSEPKEDIFGRQYTQHYDENYNETGRTETREDIFGRPYQQHISPEGDDTGHSEEREGFFGDRDVQHFNEQGDSAGRSEPREDVFGREYVQHFDKEGNPAGRSEEREDIFGGKYTKHEEE